MPRADAADTGMGSGVGPRGDGRACSVCLNRFLDHFDTLCADTRSEDQRLRLAINDGSRGWMDRCANDGTKHTNGPPPGRIKCGDVVGQSLQNGAAFRTTCILQRPSVRSGEWATTNTHAGSKRTGGEYGVQCSKTEIRTDGHSITAEAGSLAAIWLRIAFHSSRNVTALSIDQAERTLTSNFVQPPRQVPSCRRGQSARIQSAVSQPRRDRQPPPALFRRIGGVPPHHFAPHLRSSERSSPRLVKPFAAFVVEQMRLGQGRG